MDFEVSFTFQTKLPFALIHTKPILVWKDTTRRAYIQQLEL